MATRTATPALASAISVQRFQALSDENRLRILDALRGGERCVCELAEALDLAQPLLSFHLKKLKEAELVSDRREGRWAYYFLVSPSLESLHASLGELEHDARHAGPSACGPDCC